MEEAAAPQSAADGRQRILESAMTLFARNGYAGTSVRQIAEVSGMTKAGLYHHFADKATLYRAVIVETSRYLDQHTAGGVAEGIDPAARVRALLQAQARTFVEKGHLVRLFYSNLFLAPEDVPPLGDDLSAHECALIEVLEVCAARGLLDPGKVPSVSTLLMGGLELVGAAWLIDPRRPAPSAELADQLLAVAAPKIASAAGIDDSILFPEKGSRL